MSHLNPHPCAGGKLRHIQTKKGLFDAQRKLVPSLYFLPHVSRSARMAGASAPVTPRGE